VARPDLPCQPMIHVGSAPSSSTPLICLFKADLRCLPGAAAGRAR
jgi:hypothetical protein